MHQHAPLLLTAGHDLALAVGVLLSQGCQDAIKSKVVQQLSQLTAKHQQERLQCSLTAHQMAGNGGFAAHCETADVSDAFLQWEVRALQDGLSVPHKCSNDIARFVSCSIALLQQ